MKLFTKYSRITVLVTILIFLAASAAFYFTLNYVLLNQVDEDLKIERREIISYVEKYKRLPDTITVHDQVITYTPTTSSDTKRYFSTINLQDQHDKDWEKFRQLNFNQQAAGQWYKVTVSKSLEDTDDLIHSVLIITLTTILLILIASFIINRFVLKKLWKPFYESLDTVKHFRVNKDSRLHFPKSEIEEFNFMNQSLQTLTRQAQTDYIALKTFSENASHEIQTPIAIIRSKLDLLIQEEGLSQKQSDNLGSAYNAVQRLTTLNQHLLLLARIENKQFNEVTPLNFTGEVEKKLRDFSELWSAEDIEIETALVPVTTKMNPDLANILLNNLLSNATKHNFSHGKIYIGLTQTEMVIKNTSEEPALDQTKLFNRFYKPSQTGHSNGLGLSIIKQICDVSNFTISYNYGDSLHTFTVYFH